MSNTKTMKINVGPQHPSTHGVLRLVLELEGEVIKSAEPVIGYLHRGLEKMAENRTYLQYLPIVDRVDYLSGFFNSYAYCDAVENIAQIEVPRKAQYIRVLTMELNRISSNLLWLGCYLLDLGATSPLFYAFRDREILLSLFEELTGQRMMYNYYTFGGVKYDLTRDWLDKVLNFIKTMPKNLKDYENIITDNPIFTSRTKNVGLLAPQTALDYSITGVNLRASGINVDFRKKMPYLCYEALAFEPAVTQEGDCFARYFLKLEEIRIALSLAEQCIDYLKANEGIEISANIKPMAIKVPEGEYISRVEAPRGLLECHLVSDGSGKPYRLKWRTGSFYAVQVLPKLLEGAMYADLMAILGSLDLILPEVDR